MIEEEQGHGEMFLELNRRCLPEIYEQQSRYFTKLGRLDAVAFKLATAVPYQLTFLLWFITALEEYSIHLSRSYIKGDPVESLGELEPNFVRLHAEHAKDETRHVHTGLNLIDACAGSAVKRRFNAWLLTRFIRNIVVPKRSGVIAVRRLVIEHPELEPQREELIAALRDLKDDERFQKSLFNRSLMPRTFQHLDGKPEFRKLGRVMRGYDRRAPV
jgi:predicted metal-dependent hydrolase